ncbi:MAG: FAD-dependent monooxygenase [Gammaproteobacteria bacterium]|nr:FAD-dependent monooxygenase [Gammaproteobacteria bacterium]
MTDKHITLIGAGLVGSLTAVFLAKRGFTVDVYERRPDMRKENISAGRSINLALANRGIHPLEKAGLMDDVWPMLTTMKGRMIHDKTGQCHLQPYGQRPEEVIYSVPRADLNKLCMTAAEQHGNVTIHFNHKCNRVDFENNTVELEDTLTNTVFEKPFTRIIGTDGSASSVREAIHERTSSHNFVEPLGHGYKELTIPRGQQNKFQIEEQALHIWPRGGFMVIALPNKDGSFTVTLFMPNEGPVSFSEINNEQKLKDFFAQEFPDALPLLPNLVEEYFENPTGNLATVRCKPWHYQDKAIIIGDAAHAIVPFHGQGMNCGFEDAWELTQQIDQHGDEWIRIFSNTDSQRYTNGNAIADMAIENYIEMRDSVNDPVFRLKKELSFELEKRWPTLFIPRYSMVMFHRLPYSEAQARGKIQQEILSQLVEDKTQVEQVDFKLAEKLIHDKLSEFVFTH